MKKIINIFKYAWLFALPIMMVACYPNDDIPVTDLDTTSTFYKTEHLTTAPTSAALVWEVLRLKFGDGDDLPYDGDADATILNTTLDELVSLYGIDSVIIISETNDPPYYNPNVYDGLRVVVPNENEVAPYVESLYLPSVALREKEVTYYYPGYGWWGGYWGWGYGYSSSYYYPGYPGGCYWCYGGGYAGTITYEVGSVVLDMIDVRQLANNPELPEDVFSWVGIVRGVLSYSTPAEAQIRIEKGIKQAFTQSTYLK